MNLQNLDDSRLPWIHQPHSLSPRLTAQGCGSMSRLSFYQLCVALGIMSTLLTACGAFSANPLAEGNTTPDPVAIAPADGDAERTLPEIKIAPLTVEGEANPIELKLFNHEALPFITYIPAQDFVAEPLNLAAGKGATFYFNPSSPPTAGNAAEQRAYVQVVIPATATSLDRMRSSILSPQGILPSQGWQIVDRTEVVSYAWAKEKIVYRATGDNTTTGAIFIGEYGNQAFYVLTHYPAEFSDGFEPRAAMILENFELKE